MSIVEFGNKGAIGSAFRKWCLGKARMPGSPGFTGLGNQCETSWPFIDSE